MSDTLVQQLAAHGYLGRIVSIQRLYDLKEVFKRTCEASSLDPTFFDERLTNFIFELPEELPQSRSLIIVAYKDPLVRFSFNWHGRTFTVTVPPTYLHWRAKEIQADKVVRDLLKPCGYIIAKAMVPQKLLAVCSGLATYGKNNIVYINGMGSFISLAAFFSDLPCDQDEWRTPKMMDRCEKCKSCLSSCPTGAIDQDRFLLRAERCLTFFNEKPGHVVFPEWTENVWHNSLIGCMSCQCVCPENRAMLDWVEDGEEFVEEEIELLLADVPVADLPISLKKKLERWDLLDLLEYIPRNLSVLLSDNKN